MKSKRFMLGLLVMVLAFGMTLVGCGDGDDGGGSGGFTLTGIPAQYNNKYAIFFAGGDDDGPSIMLVGAQDFTVNQNGMSGKAAQIKNGSVSLPMWTMSETTGDIVKYSGNDTVTGGLMIFETQTVSQTASRPTAERYFESVTFSSGKASKTWSQGVDDDDDGDGTPVTPH